MGEEPRDPSMALALNAFHSLPFVFFFLVSKSIHTLQPVVQPAVQLAGRNVLNI